MRERYADEIYALNEVYGMSFGSFDALLEARDWRPAVDPSNAGEARDNLAFIEKILDRYYGVMTATIRRRDTNHLIFGDKLNRNTDTPDFAVTIAAKHNDLTFYQWYGYYGEQKERLARWSQLTRKPLLNGDAGLSSPSVRMPHPDGADVRDQQAHGERRWIWGGRRLSGLTSWVGTIVAGSTRGTRCRAKSHASIGGLQDPFGRHYEPMVLALRTVAAEMYQPR